MEQQYGQRISNLEREVHGLGTAIGALQAQGSATANRVDKIGDAIDRMIDQKSNQTPIFTPSLVLAIVAAFGALIVGGSQLMDMQVTKLETTMDSHQVVHAQQIQNIEEHLTVLEDARHQTHYEVARLHSLRDTLKLLRQEDQTYQRHHDDQYHKLEEKVDTLSREAAAATTARRAIGDYVKEHIANHPECDISK